MDFRQLASDRDLRVAPRDGEGPERADDPERRLEQDRGPFAPGVGRVPPVALPAARGREAEERERHGREAARGEDCENGRWPGQGLDVVPRGGGSGHEPLSGVGDRRRAGVRDERDRLARREAREDLVRSVVLVVLVAGKARRRKAVPCEEVVRAARVLAENDARRGERLAGPGGQVVQVADRRRDDEEASAHVGIVTPLLRSPAMPALPAAAVLLVLAAPGTPPVAPPPASSPAARGAVLDRIAAVVGDEIILESDVGKLVAVRYLASKPGENEGAYRDRILDVLITDALRERELRKAGGLEPEPAEVEARLKALENRVEAERGRTFDEVLREAGVTRGEAAAYVRRGLMLQTFVRERLTPAIRVTDAEIKAYYDGPFRDEARRKGLEKLPPMSEVTDEIRDLLRERKLNEAIKRWTEDLRQSTRILIYRR